MPTHIYLIRHGQSVANVANDYSFEHSNMVGTPLTPIGHEQVKKRAQEFSQKEISALYCSDMLRAEQTALAFSEVLNQPVIMSASLRERLFTQKPQEDENRIRGEFSAFLKTQIEKGGSFDLEMKIKFSDEMETGHDIIARVINFLQNVTTTHQDQTIAAICHNNVIRTVLTFLDYSRFGKLANLAIENTGYVLLEKVEDKLVVRETMGLFIN